MLGMSLAIFSTPYVQFEKRFDFLFVYRCVRYVSRRVLMTHTRTQGWGRLQKPDYDYSAHKIIDYDYSGD